MSKVQRVCLSLTCVFAVMGSREASAQSVTVQQPVVQQFGVRTAVSVPDRGSVLLGSVSSAQTLSRSRGPSLPASGLSQVVNHNDARVHVFIHDHEAMDRAVLAEAERQRALTPASTLTGMAAHAQRSLLNRHTSLQQRRP